MVNASVNNIGTCMVGEVAIKRDGDMELKLPLRDQKPTDTVDSQSFRTFSTRQIAFFVAERPMAALLLRLLLQCAGDIKMNPGPVSTPTPTNCLRLIQWNANGISGKIIEQLTFLLLLPWSPSITDDDEFLFNVEDTI